MRAHAIIPALDEEETISKVVAQVFEQPIAGVIIAAVIVVDNGSTDRTAERAEAAGAVVISQPERGYGAACLAAIDHLAAEPGTDVVVFIDADGQSDPSDLAALIAPVAAGEADLVIGSRVLGAEAGALNPVQRFGNWFAASLLNTFYGAETTDLGPTRAISLAALRRLEMRDRGFGWTIEMQARAALVGLRVTERPVRYRPRAAGVSKISGTLRGSVRAGAAILWTVCTVYARHAASRER